MPLTVDLEGGYSDDPDDVAALAAHLHALGVAGINLEDGRPDGQLRPADEHAAIISAVTAPAGQISIVVSNRGWRTHELVILPLTANAAPGRRVTGADGKVIETDSLGEASASCAHGAGHGITAGTVAWTTVTLTAGHYELLCNLANHYTDGMHEELTVT